MVASIEIVHQNIGLNFNLYPWFCLFDFFIFYFLSLWRIGLFLFRDLNLKFGDYFLLFYLEFLEVFIQGFNLLHLFVIIKVRSLEICA
jgi:hypothetical protein